MDRIGSHNAWPISFLENYWGRTHHFCRIICIFISTKLVTMNRVHTRNQIFGCISNNSQKKMGRTRVFFNFLPIFWQNVTIFHRTKSGFRVLNSLLRSYIIMCVGGERNQSEWCSSNTYFILMENKKRAQFLMKYHCASARFYLGFYFSIKKILVVGDGSWSSFGQPRKCNLKKGNNFEKDANFVVLKKLSLTKIFFLNIFFLFTFATNIL